MITHCDTVEAAVREIFDPSVSVVSRQGTSGGCINETACLKLSNNKTVFLKANSSRYRGMFLAEAKGLLALRQEGGPKVPSPLAYYEGKHEQFILLSYIKPGRPHRHHYRDFGHAFASLHRQDASRVFGFEHDNYIGSTFQRNQTCDSWVSFYRDHRLGFQIDLAAKKGLASSALVKKVEQLMAKLGEIIDEPKHPSILHGDLWTGNAMADENGDAVIFDPAAYYGHYEADMAMTELFGRFPSDFYSAYNEVLPLTSEYGSTRKTIYNLYHILNHLNIFGPSYAGQAMSMVSHFV